MHWSNHTRRILLLIIATLLLTSTSSAVNTEGDVSHNYKNQVIYIDADVNETKSVEEDVTILTFNDLLRSEVRNVSMENEETREQENVELEKEEDVTVQEEETTEESQEDEPDLSAEEVTELKQEMEEKLNSVNEMLEQINLAYSEENSEKENQIAILLTEVESILVEYPEEFSDIRESFDKSKEGLDKYVKMIQGIREKLSNFTVTNKMDMSKTIGFTAEELKYFLTNAESRKGKKLVPEELVEPLAEVITESLEEYEVNEILVISIMSWESGYFSSKLAKNKNNFAGMMKNGTGMKFETKEDGIAAAVRCIFKNMKGNNTIYEINKTYCPGDDYVWSKNVLSIMKTYASSKIVE